MNNILHEEVSFDSLYKDINWILDHVYKLWADGESRLGFSIPILCAAKLEAFINVAGELKVEGWETLEHKLTFVKKCRRIFKAVELRFDRDIEPNKTALSTFQIRNELVHPKMEIRRIRQHISRKEYDRRSQKTSYVNHRMRTQLTAEKIKDLKNASDAFVSKWGEELLDGNPNLWLLFSSVGSFSINPDSTG